MLGKETSSNRSLTFNERFKRRHKAPLSRQPSVRSKPATAPSFFCLLHRLQAKSRQPTDQSDALRERRKSPTLIRKRRSWGGWCREMSRQFANLSTIYKAGATSRSRTSENEHEPR